MQWNNCRSNADVFSVLGKWGRTQMGSDGFNRILTGFCLLGAARVRPVPSETHDFKGFRPDINRILTGLWPDFKESG